MVRWIDGAQRCIPVQRPQQTLFDVSVLEAYIHQGQHECQSSLRDTATLIDD